MSLGEAYPWLLDNGTLLGALGLIGLVSPVASVLLLPYLVVRILADYFRHRTRWHEYARDRHPAAHHAILILKNGLGVLLILAGIAMLALPEQGLLTLLIGVMPTDFPGKYRLEDRLIGAPGVLKALNWLCVRAAHPSLERPSDGDCR